MVLNKVSEQLLRTEWSLLAKLYDAALLINIMTKTHKIRTFWVLSITLSQQIDYISQQ